MMERIRIRNLLKNNHTIIKMTNRLFRKSYKRRINNKKEQNKSSACVYMVLVLRANPLVTNAMMVGRALSVMNQSREPPILITMILNRI